MTKKSLIQEPPTLGSFGVLLYMIFRNIERERESEVLYRYIYIDIVDMHVYVYMQIYVYTNTYYLLTPSG